MSEVLNFIIDAMATWTEKNGYPPEELVMHPRLFSVLRNLHHEFSGPYGYPSGISLIGGVKVLVDSNLSEDYVILRAGHFQQGYGMAINVQSVNKKKSIDRFKKKRLIRIKEG